MPIFTIAIPGNYRCLPPGRSTSASSATYRAGKLLIKPGLSLRFPLLSLQTWELTEMCTPEKPRHMGRYWCWVFWEFKVDVLRYGSSPRYFTLPPSCGRCLNMAEYTYGSNQNQTRCVPRRGIMIFGSSVGPEYHQVCITM